MTSNIGGSGQEQKTSETQLFTALQDASNVIDQLTHPYPPRFILIQAQVPGRHYRVLVLRSQVLSILERVSADIVGDGKSTIRRLIERENENPWRKSNQVEIPLDRDLFRLLEKESMTIDSVPSSGQYITLHSPPTFQSALTIDRTDEAHASFRRLFGDICYRTRIPQLAVDITCDDISKPLESQKYYVIYMDVRSQIAPYYTPWRGKPRNVIRAILADTFPKLNNDPLFKLNGGPAPNPML